MNPSQSYSSNNRFIGRWIGETQECERPAHLWEIAHAPTSPYLLTILASRENTPQVTTHVAHLRSQDSFVVPYQPVIRFSIDPSRQALDSQTPDFIAVLVDSQHFIIPGWDTNETPNNAGPAYDVVFSRPGLAELVAHEVWLRYKAQAAGK
jgi:hypothetical protein